MTCALSGGSLEFVAAMAKPQTDPWIRRWPTLGRSAIVLDGVTLPRTEPSACEAQGQTLCRRVETHLRLCPSVLGSECSRMPELLGSDRRCAMPCGWTWRACLRRVGPPPPPWRFGLRGASPLPSGPRTRTTLSKPDPARVRPHRPRCKVGRAAAEKLGGQKARAS